MDEVTDVLIRHVLQVLSGEDFCLGFFERLFDGVASQHVFLIDVSLFAARALLSSAIFVLS